MGRRQRLVCAGLLIGIGLCGAARSEARGPAADPGHVALFKLRKAPPGEIGAVGVRETGLSSLDALLAELDAWVFAAFPFDRGETRDRVGLDRWIVVELPPGTDVRDAVARLRGSRAILRESYWPEDAAFLRVAARPDWPTRFVPPRGERTARRVAPRRGGSQAPAAMAETLRRTGADAAWSAVRGYGVGIAVIDSGVDVNHRALAGSLRAKHAEEHGVDADGNGIPGDAFGVNFAHLAIAHADPAPPVLGLGLAADLADWDGAFGGRPRDQWGHGTGIAALAAGRRTGAAPGAWLLAVDVQPNLRPAEGAIPERDPRQRGLAGEGAARAAPPPSVWALAAGVVYAAAEGARVLTCAWPDQQPSWLLHDALLFAEENCVLSVCAQASGAFPVSWEAFRARARAAGSGELRDAFDGALASDFYARPLRGLIAVGEPGADVDLAVPALATPTAVSVPANDAAPFEDVRTALAAPDVRATALTAGAAALLLERRPDLDSRTLRAALIDGASDGVLHVPGALARADRATQGSCQEERAAESEREPFWKRIKIRTKYGIDTGGPGPDLEPLPR